MTLVEPQCFLNNLEQKLKLLSAQQQMAFGAMCCERHLPEYLRFSAEQDWGDPDALRLAIDSAWTMVVDDKKMNQQELKGLLEKCIAATPDSDEFPTVISDYAQDVAIMVCLLLQFLENCNPVAIVQVASRARDLIDAKVQVESKLEPTDPKLEEKIASGELMVSEIAKQKSDLEMVSNAKEPLELARLRKLA
jgi:uncharacterized protein YjaG (DUF416 family)